MIIYKYFLSTIFSGLLFFSSINAQEWTQLPDEQGLVVISAENYSSYRPGIGEKESETFTFENSIQGFIGDGYMKSNMLAGDGSIENAENSNIKLSYNINFTKTGTHYLWAHVFFPTPTEDSFFYGLNGKVSDQIAGAPRGMWNWHKGNAPLEIDSVGLITLDIFGREPNSLIDHIIITTDPDFDPTTDDYSLVKQIAFISLPGKEDENGNHPDQPFIEELISKGYEVFTTYSSALELESKEFTDTLNSADLVIIGRSVSSGDFGGSHRAAWNSIKAPLMTLQPFTARSNRLNWLATESTISDDRPGDTINAFIEFPDDEVFSETVLDADRLMAWVMSPYDYMSITNGGNGTVIARESPSSNVLFVRWEPWLEFYDGAGEMPAGYRTLIGNGNDHANAVNGAPFNYNNFTDEARQVYLREVGRMVNLPQVPQMQEDVTQIFVAADGDDENPGTIEAPFASIQKAQQVANAGDTIYIRGGLYQPTEEDISQVVNGLFASITFLNKSGTEGNPINYWAYPGETPVFDFSNIRPEGRRVVGIYVQGSYLHLKGLEMTGIQTTITSHTESYCIYSRGNNNIYEQIVMHDNVGTGLRHFAGGGNLFLNCDAYNNWDNVSEDKTGSNNDGFGCHPSLGAAVNVFKGCRAWFNSDDGFDVIRADESVVFDSCWAFYNGYSSSFQSLGDGNGFKIGGFAFDQANEIPDVIPRHTIRFCVAVRNKANGFYANHHLGGNDWFNNSGYNNATSDFNMLNRPSRENATNIDGPGYDHVMKNNMAFAQFGTGVSNIPPDLNTLEANTWTLGINVAATDFISIEMDQLATARNDDGSLPSIDFLFPSSGSAVIDAGVNIDFPFLGASPDLGAFEFDGTSSTYEVNGNESEQISLFQNHPNPFDNNTNITYKLSEPSYVTLDIYNLYGRKVYTLIDGSHHDQGVYQLNWDGNTFSGARGVPGVYIYLLSSINERGHNMVQKKMILSK
jgi:hypothetical protein